MGFPPIRGRLVLQNGRSGSLFGILAALIIWNGMSKIKFQHSPEGKVPTTTTWRGMKSRITPLENAKLKGWEVTRTIFRNDDIVKQATNLLFSLVLAFFVATAAGAEQKPNIIYLMADDLGIGDVGCYGQKILQTPNVDQLAAEGMRFTDCYAGAVVCAPSRSVLMTGLHTGHTRVRGNFARVGGVPPQGRVPLEPEDVTVAEVLKSAGYVTGITGKWGLGEPNTTGVPNRQGFDEWFGYLNQRNAHSYYPPYLWKNEEKVILKGNQDGKRGEYTHDMFHQWELDFIRRHKDQPFFLYGSWTIPHAKYEVPDLGPFAGKEKEWSKDDVAYAAMVLRMDGYVGRIMALLKELKIDDRTIVFFCSDNGGARRREGLFDSCGPFREKKGSVYEGGIRVPMIVRWPGKVPAGTTSDQPWYFADVLPTFAALAGAAAPKNIDGLNVLPAILGKEQIELRRRFLYWESHNLHQAVRWGMWKAVRMGVDKPLELYDLEKDEGETTDVAVENPDAVKKIKAYLRTARFDSPNWPTTQSGDGE
jgi:arylsulfatase A-like enzyme